ncbi:MAG: hypothetical protein ACRDOH_27475 [Streptosporangiaceae bacterium]
MLGVADAIACVVGAGAVLSSVVDTALQIHDALGYTLDIPWPPGTPRCGGGRRAVHRCQRD